MTRTPYTPTGRRYDRRKRSTESAALLTSIVLAAITVIVVGLLIRSAVTTAQHRLEQQMDRSSQHVAAAGVQR